MTDEKRGRRVIAQLYRAEIEGRWDGDSLNDLIAAETNLPDAEADPDGNVWSGRNWLPDQQLNDIADRLKENGA